MVDRTPDPHKLVSLSPATGRLPDGERVPHRPAAPAPARWPGWVIAGIALALMAVGIAGLLS